MTALIEALIGDLGKWLAGGVLLLIGGAAAFLRGRNVGKAKERQKAKEADHEQADALRRHVDRNLDQRVREMDGRGYRD